MKPVPEVIDCSAASPNRVKLRFRDGWVGELDLAPALHGPIFGPLRRPDEFREVVVRDGTLAWPNGADICPTVLRYWCELGRVCSQEELDSHFAESRLSETASRKVAETPSKYSARRKKSSH